MCVCVCCSGWCVCVGGGWGGGGKSATQEAAGSHAQQQAAEAEHLQQANRQLTAELQKAQARVSMSDVFSMCLCVILSGCVCACVLHPHDIVQTVMTMTCSGEY